MVPGTFPALGKIPHARISGPTVISNVPPLRLLYSKQDCSNENISGSVVTASRPASRLMRDNSLSGL